MSLNADVEDAKHFVGQFGALLVEVEAVERENEQLMNLLKSGRSRVGEFHASLMLDNIRLVNERAALRDELEQVRKQESTLRQRLQFLFDDCQRLSRDNDLMVEEARRRDEELAATERLLRQQRTVLQGAFRNLDREKLACRAAAEALHESNEGKLKMREKVILQHRSRWEMQDRLDKCNQEAEYMKLLQSVEEKKPPRSLRQLPLMPSSMRLTDESFSQICMRPDCVQIRAEVTRLLAQRT